MHFHSIISINVAANARIPMYMKSQKVERNGEEYVRINDISAGYEILGDFKMDVNFNTLIPNMIKDAVNEHANANWRQLKPEMERAAQKYLSDAMREAVTQILEKIPIRDFFLSDAAKDSTSGCNF